uniref:GPI-anchor transamidase n=1 Tax=Laticauda laticaudata TaxID=8630 RepID=A0A8C5SX22_LATLA
IFILQSVINVQKGKARILKYSQHKNWSSINNPTFSPHQGHGGNGFLKFQDSEEITNVELADAFEQMWQKRRYNELLFIIDTCQGASMYERFYSPNIMALASSQVGEDSLSHQPDLGIGVHLMDRYTFYVLEFLEEINPASQTNMNDLFQVCPKSLCVSTPGHRTDLFQRNPNNVLITDFFGSVRKVEITTETVSLDPNLAPEETRYFGLFFEPQIFIMKKKRI